MRRGILERDAELALLANAVREAADSHGSVVLVMGEAGIGKSSLVEALRSHLAAEGRMLVGYCDDLATPRTLGPFRDLAGSVGTELSRAVADGSDRDRRPCWSSRMFTGLTTRRSTRCAISSGGSPTFRLRSS